MAHVDIYLDIETLPALWMSDEQKLALVESKVPKNYKNPEKIAEWKAVNADGAFRKTSFDPTKGNLLMVGLRLVRDGEQLDVVTLMARYRESETAELDLMTEAFLYLSSNLDPGDIVTFIGHNVRGCDLPWLILRAIKYDLKWLAEALTSARVVDTMDLAALKRNRPSYSVSLEAFCSYVGVPAKNTGLHGSDVYDVWKGSASDPEAYKAIAPYCEDDVLAVEALHQKLKPVADMRRW